MHATRARARAHTPHPLVASHDEVIESHECRLSLEAEVYVA